MCCQVGIETDPKHSMPTVRSSASGGCHATSCPIKGLGKGKGRVRKRRELRKEVYLKTNPKTKVKTQNQFYVILNRIVQNTLKVTGFDSNPTLFENWGCEMALTVSELSKGV